MPKRFFFNPLATGTGESDHPDEFCLGREARDLAAKSTTIAVRKASPKNAKELGKQIRIARKLLDATLFLTGYLEYIHKHRPDIIGAICKEYPYFPVALPAANGGETKQILAKIKGLNIGENGPFKKSKGRRKHDPKNRLIFVAIANVMKRDPTAPMPSKATARLWAVKIADYIAKLRSDGYNVDPNVLVVVPKGMTIKRRRKKVKRIKKAFGVKRITEQNGPSPDILYATDRELDWIEATRLQQRMKNAQATPSSSGDQREAFVDFYEKRIRSLLK